MAADHPATRTNLIAHADWFVCELAPGLAVTPGDLEALGATWHHAPVPGTAAAAMLASGMHPSGSELDGMDWWWRCDVHALPGVERYQLQVDGVATIWEIWLDDDRILHGDNMYLGQTIELDLPAGSSRLYVHCLPLTATLAMKRPRPRWRSSVVSDPNLRWIRTTMLGRSLGWTVTPPPVGPWRQIAIRPAEARYCAHRLVRSECDQSGEGGRVEVDLTLWGPWKTTTAELEIRRRSDQTLCRVELLEQPLRSMGPGDSDARLLDDATPGTTGRTVTHVRLAAHLDVVERWWPHTHGSQPLYDVVAVLDDERITLGAVGFRTIEVDRTNGAFEVRVNDVALFVRGAAWYPLDPVSLVSSDSALVSTLELARDAHLNMVRIPGGTVYEEDRFFDVCDELGILVWQDVMLAFVDPPEEDDFVAHLVAELDQVLAPLSRHPCLAIVCGDQESDQHAAMFGLTKEERSSSIIDEIIPRVVARVLGSITYVASSPTGGEPPFRTDVGICHYYGVGAFLRPIEDSKLANVRFMSEGLAFAIPPEDETVIAEFGRASVVGHDPKWKAAIHHEAGKAFDLEDVRDYYVREHFGTDPLLSRYLDAEYHLDLGRAIICEIFTDVLGWWRDARSACDGALLIALRDLVPGAGWGVVDALGRPKAPWYTLRRLFDPIAAFISDEGLNGPLLHLFNDTQEHVKAVIDIALFGQAEMALAEIRREVLLDDQGQLDIDLGGLFGGFKDLGYAYRFGAIGVDAIRVDVEIEGHSPIQSVYLPGGPRRNREVELGLHAIARRLEDGEWVLTVSTRRVAQYVCIDIPGFVAEDSWFHLTPGTQRSLRLFADGRRQTPRGSVRALNSYRSVGIEIAD
jgi:beta-mannosidase